MMVRESVPDMKNFTPEMMEKFLHDGGKRASAILSLLGKNQQFVNAIMTPIGKEILTECAQSMQEIMQLILDEKDTPENRAEFRVLRKITDKWTMKINAYYSGMKEVHETVSKAE